jgi:hypothetical protein
MQRHRNARPNRPCRSQKRYLAHAGPRFSDYERTVRTTETSASSDNSDERKPLADHRNAPVNALGHLRVMFAVDDIDETLGRLRKRGAQLVGEVGIRTLIGFPTPAGLKGSSSDSPRNSTERDRTRLFES